MRLDLGIDWSDDDSDVWYTPPSIFEALGLQFDLDPAAPIGGVPWIPATRHYSEKDDGLSQPWRGLVWLNPPYSDPGPWLARMLTHRNGVMLVPADTSTRWWHESCIGADAFCFLRGRLRFVRDKESTSAAFPSVLVAYGDEASDAVVGLRLGWVVDQRR